MATPIIKIASLEIQTDNLVKELRSTKLGIKEVTDEQDKLKKAGGENSEAFIRNEAHLKSLRSEYGRQIKTLNAVTDGENKLNEGLNKEINTVDEAILNNKELRTVRNQINANTDEGAAAIANINAKLDENTEFVKENGSELENLKMNVGNYREDIKAAANDLNIFNGGIGGFIAKSKEAGGAGKLVTNSFKTMAVGLGQVTKAGLAFIATPIGLVVTALAGVFALVKNSMDRSEESTRKISKAAGAFTGILKGVLKILEPVGEFLINGLVKGMEMAEKSIYKTMNVLSQGLELIGLDSAAKKVSDFNKEIQESAKNSKELADAENLLDKATRKARITQLEYQKDAEKLRQIRDDESKTITERVKANEDLGGVLAEQLETELRLAETALKVANIRIQADGETKEALDAQADALTEIADIRERITGQESEQIVNRVSLQKEAIELAKEAANDSIENQKKDLDIFIASQGIKARTLAEEVNLLRSTSEKRKVILDSELKARNITQKEYDLELLNIKNELLEAQANATLENAHRELAAYIEANDSKLDSDKFLTQQSVNQEKERLDGIAEQRKQFAEAQLAEGVINQNQYNEAISLVDEENRIAKEEVEAERKEAKKQAEILDFENKLITDRERLETDLALNLEYLNSERKAELADAEKTGADKSKIEKKYGEYETAIRREVAANKLSLASGTLSSMVDILGKESAAGKSVAVVQATIDTYASAVSAFNSMSGIPIVGPVLGGIAAAAAVASGIATVKKIVSTPKPSVPKASKGMLIGGRRHAQGGTLIEAEQGEAIMSRGAVSKYGGLLSQLNADVGGIPFMENGGLVGSNSYSNSGIIDYDLLSLKVSEANASLPAPKVSVEEIKSVSTRVAVIESETGF